MRLINTFWVFIFPFVFNVWSIIVMKTSFQSLPHGEIYWQIILPLSMPMVATIRLFQSVMHWNGWFTGAFYTCNPVLHPLQTFLRLLLEHRGGPFSLERARTMDELADAEGRLRVALADQLLRMSLMSVYYALVIICVVPIVVVFPFAQRYFIKGY